MAVEHAPANQRGLYGSWVQIGVPAGTMIANLAFLAIAWWLSPEELLAWGWRIAGGTLLRRAKRARPETWLYRKLEWVLASRWRLDGSPFASTAPCPVPVAAMSRFRNKVDTQQAHIFSLRLAVVILALVCAGLWYGWRSAPTDLTVHVPPDLRSGSTRKWWDVPPENVYAFALYIFGQLNRWPSDGEQDYRRAIYGLQSYLTWVEYLDTEQCFLLDDNRSVGAVFELLPIGTEGREPDWLMAARDALEDALQDSFDELDQAPWVAQFFCQDDNDFTPYLTRLTDYIQDSARATVFTEAYLELSRRHLKAIAKPGGLFEDKVVTRLPWRGNNRRVRLVVYRWLESDAEETGLNPVQSLHQACERIAASLQACGVQTTRVDGRGLYAWLVPWFNPAPRLTDEAPEEFYRRVTYPESGDGESLELPFDHDFAERLFFNEPRSDVQHGLWFFDDQPHRVMVVDKLRRAPLIGQLTGEMGESIDLFCQGFEGELFDREGTSWPESDVTIVDLATYAREGYEAQMSISYISLMNTVNNLAERDQYLGRPIIMVTDEGHIITKNPLLAPFVVKGTKMWRKLGAWFWLATQNLADFPTAAQTMLNMIEWWICLNMPPAEIEEIARFKKLTPAQKALLLSASKEPGKYTEGVVLSKKLETLFRAVPPSLYLALAMTEPEEKAQRWTLMQENRCSELEAAYRVAERIDIARGIESA